MKHNQQQKIILILSVVFTIASFFSCENDIKQINSIADNGKVLPTESDKNVQIIYSDSAITRAKLFAVELDRYVGKKSYTELPKGMKIYFFDAQGKQKTKLTADYGIGFDDGGQMNQMEAKRHVVVINAKGERLDTEHLIWNAVTKKIYTDEFVRITTKDETIWGDGLEANEDFSQYEIKHPKGEKEIKNNDI